MKTWTTMIVGVSLAAAGVVTSLSNDAAATDSADELQSEPAHRVSETRLLRRATMALLGRAPTTEEYEAILAVPAEGQREAVYETIEQALDGTEFEAQILRWGMEYLRAVSYDYAWDPTNTSFHGDYGFELERCGETTTHAGAMGLLSASNNQFGQNREICNDPGAELNTVEPWWAPGTTVTLIGYAGQDIRESNGVDCGHAYRSRYWPEFGCSCGPNAIYCERQGGPDDSDTDPVSMRRAAFEEPARLFRHIIREDRPFSDLVLGDYTVVNRGLHYMYVRNGRQNSDNAWMDDQQWWRDYADDDQWVEIPFEQMHPDLLSDRDYTFDPRTDPGVPEGVPSAGVMSMLGTNYSFPRERVRAARWLETFACREFAPPPADVEFVDYQRDPGTEGSCEHCHQLIDPAAMHFKRMYGGGAQLGGIGSWDLAELPSDHPFRVRSERTFEYDTLMTPVPQGTLETNPNAALIDFMPPEYRLFGEQSDGTIGPLGFAKLLVNSGEFDRCAVRRFYQWVAGQQLLPGRDDAQINALVDEFVAGDRSVRSLVMSIVRSDEYRIGW